jgi:hypothetical protein
MAGPATDPRSRQLGDERARYGRKSLREQLDDLAGWVRAHPIASGVVAGFFLIGALLSLARGNTAEAGSLAVGDCIYVHTAAAQGSDRPIGEEREVTVALLAGDAELAGCGGSHGHEVSAIVVPEPPPTGAPGVIGQALDAAAMRTMVAPLCEAAFAGYVGRPLAGSVYTTFPVVPDAKGAEAWLDGGRRTICLLARIDGQWLGHPARGSGE